MAQSHGTDLKLLGGLTSKTATSAIPEIWSTGSGKDEIKSA